MSTYYKDQLNRINTRAEFSPKIKVFDSQYKHNDTNHMDLNPESAQVLIDWLTENYINPAKPRDIEFTRVNSDTFGNPRYVCHYTDISPSYEAALKFCKSFGGRKFNNKQFNGGIVFQSYNIENDKKRLLQALKELQ